MTLRSSEWAVRVLVLALLLVASGGRPAFPQDEAQMGVSLHFPPDGSYFGKPKGLAAVAGRVLYPGEAPPAYDVILVLDTSGSTSWPTGADVDGDGITGTPFNISRSRRRPIPINSDPDDSVLCAEVMGAQRLLRLFDPSITQVGLVTFSGDHTSDYQRPIPETPDALLEHPLTSEYEGMDRVLREVYQREPTGGTNMAEGIRVAMEGLTRPEARPPAKKVMILLTDGLPTFPHGNLAETDSEDKELTLQAAQKAAQAGITLHTFAIGPGALSDPYTASEMARLSGGIYTPVKQPAEVINLLPGIRLIGVKSLTVENVTLGRPAAQTFLGPDGLFLANLPVSLGPNVIRATATSSRGEKGEATITLYYVEDENSQELGLDLNRDNVAELKLTLERQRQALLDPEAARLLELRAKRKGIEKGKEQLELELEKK